MDVILGLRAAQDLSTESSYKGDGYVVLKVRGSSVAEKVIGQPLCQLPLVPSGSSYYTINKMTKKMVCLTPPAADESASTSSWKINSIPCPASDYTAICMSKDGSLLVTGDRTGSMMMWDFISGSLLRQFHGGFDSIKQICLSPLGSLLLCLTQAGRVHLYTTNDIFTCTGVTVEAKCEYTTTSEGYVAMHHVAGWDNIFGSSDMNSVFLCVQSTFVTIIKDFESTNLNIETNDAAVTYSAVSWDGNLLYLGLSSGSVLIYEISSLDSATPVRKEMKGHSGAIGQICISHDGNTVITSDHIDIRTWSMANQQTSHQITQFGSRIAYMATMDPITSNSMNVPVFPRSLKAFNTVDQVIREASDGVLELKGYAGIVAKEDTSVRKKRAQDMLRLAFIKAKEKNLFNSCHELKSADSRILVALAASAASEKHLNRQTKELDQMKDYLNKLEDNMLVCMKSLNRVKDVEYQPLTDQGEPVDAEVFKFKKVLEDIRAQKALVDEKYANEPEGLKSAVHRVILEAKQKKYVPSGDGNSGTPLLQSIRKHLDSLTEGPIIDHIESLKEAPIGVYLDKRHLQYKKRDRCDAEESNKRRRWV